MQSALADGAGVAALALALVALHVRRERGRRAVAAVAHRALERLLVVVRLHVDLQVVTERVAAVQYNSRVFINQQL